MSMSNQPDPFGNNYQGLQAILAAANQMPTAAPQSYEPRYDFHVGEFVSSEDLDSGHARDFSDENIPRQYISHGHTEVDMAIYSEMGAQIIYIDHSTNRAVLDIRIINHPNLRLAFNMAKMKKKGAPKPPKFDLKELNPLVVTDEVLEEIKAVLKQKQNSKKMFEEWGLGEVIEYGRGMTFLFYGPPGTGKTWAANCIAKVFGTQLLSIGAAEIQTSEPGGANRNIQNAFAEAKKSKKILFLDECDSLITNRADVGMILGGEINTLLTEIEKCEEVVILATNRIENLDEALERRISLIVEFPEPDFKQRKRIWETLIPKKLPLDKEITPARLAEYHLTGGQIKNVLLQAARLALSSESKQIDVCHIEAAVERIIKSKSLMGSASRYHQVVVKDNLKRSAD